MDAATAHSVRPYASGFWDTLWRALFFPSRVFGRPFAGYVDWRALFFAIGMVLLVIAVQQFMVYAVAPLLDGLLPVSLLVLFFPAKLVPARIVGFLLVLPVLVPVALAVYAAVLHLLLRLAQAGGRGYGATLQCVCFSTACGVLRIIPVSGEVLAVVCWLGMLAVGLRLSHAAPWHRVLPVISLHVSAVAWLGALVLGWVSLPV